MRAVGKTRLVLELAARPEFLQAPIFQAQCNEIFASTPLYPLALYLWGRVGLTADDDDAARRHKIAGYLGEIRADTEENREVVAASSAWHRRRAARRRRRPSS